MKQYLLFLLFIITACKKIDRVNPAKQVAGKVSSIKEIPLQPNIILVLVDDLGFEVPAYTGGQSYQTPQLDQLASQSIQFNQTHACPLCSPSRVELLTGLYNDRNYTAWGILTPDNITIANKLHDIGYATCVSGKWQLDGGGTAINHFGFDKYCVWKPFKYDDNDEELKSGNKYKNPSVYVDGQFPDETGKYGEDIFRNYLFDFIDSNKSQPFFALWTPDLVHKPFQPTPDDSDYAVFEPRHPADGDTIYFPSMVKYLDKEIGMLINKLDSMNLSSKTLVLFAGDNGTAREITSLWNGKYIQGGKGRTTVYGTHVASLAYWKGVTTPGIDNSLIDFTDFFPTIMDAAGGRHKGDGISFFPQIIGMPGDKRDWVFFHFYPQADDTSSVRFSRWVMNYNYKLYDTIVTDNKNGEFYNIISHPLEKVNIIDMTAVQKGIDSSFKIVLSQY